MSNKRNGQSHKRKKEELYAKQAIIPTNCNSIHKCTFDRTGFSTKNSDMHIKSKNYTENDIDE